MPKRVVLDTSVLISGLLWRGKAYQCLLLARAGVVQAVYCPEMMAELSQVLQQKFHFSASQIRAVVHDVQRFAERVEISGKMRAVASDPDDDKFVECAVVGEADVIVSGDRHLLDLAEHEGIPILDAVQFLGSIAAQGALNREDLP